MQIKLKKMKAVHFCKFRNYLLNLEVFRILPATTCRRSCISERQSKLLAYIIKCSVEAGIEATYLLNNGLFPVNTLACFDGRVLHSKSTVQVPLIGF